MLRSVRSLEDSRACVVRVDSHRRRVSSQVEWALPPG